MPPTSTAWTTFLAARGASFDGLAVTDFGDAAAELVAARDAAVACDLGPIAALQVSGADAVNFLQGQFTNDVAALELGAWQWSAWCSAKGRVLADFILRRSAEERFELLLPHVLLEPVRRRLAMFVLRAKVVIDDASGTTIRIGVGGPGAAARIAAVAGQAPGPSLATTIDGGSIAALTGSCFIVLVEPAVAPAVWDALAARPAGFACWQWLNIRAGVPVVLPPTQDQFIPQALNLDALGGVSFRKGCYAGQEIVARTQYLGRLKERLAVAHLDASAATGDRLYAPSFGDQPCGTVVNAAPAPGGGYDLLMVCQLAAIAAGELYAGASDGLRLTLLPLPYALPAPAAPRGRMA